MKLINQLLALPIFRNSLADWSIALGLRVALFTALVAALLAAVMLGGCAKQQDATATAEPAPAAGDAAAPESEASSTEAATEEPGATADSSITPSDSEAPKN